MKVLIGCEFSGTVRDAFIARGHEAWSCDLLPTESPGPHIQGDVLGVLGRGWDMAIFHPPCTYLTCSAEWAYKDPDFVRYPGVGYHMRLKPGTLTGEARRQARREAVAFVLALANSDIPKIAIENPRGHLSAAWRKPDQTIQPHQFGHNASKATCFWLKGLSPLFPTVQVAPRMVDGKPRWANQCDNGQNRLPPSDDRWAIRSVTYDGVARAMAYQWGDGWQPVRFQAECDPHGDGVCLFNGRDTSECDCLGPTQDGVEYQEENGVLYGRMEAAQ